MAGAASAETHHSKLISSLPLPHFLKIALAAAGYKDTSDVVRVSASDLSAELGIGLQQAQDVLRQCEVPSAGPSGLTSHPDAEPVIVARSSTAAELLSQATHTRFSTLSAAVDGVLSSICLPVAEPNIIHKDRNEKSSMGAITPGTVLEISGPPGIGKTAMIVSVAMSARLGERTGPGHWDQPHDDAEVLIIDTEGALAIDRIFKAAHALMRNSSIDPYPIVEGVHLIRVATQVQMIALLQTLDDWLESHPKVRLVIIDTLSFHFRQPNLDMSSRRRVMDTIKHTIAKISTVNHCAVIVVNQLATKLFTAENKQGNFDTGDKAILMPQLGELWTTAKTVRLALFRGPPGDDVRYAHASTSSTGSADANWAAFDINTDGLVCDLSDS
ncbi:hypothetical protein JCM24511_01518 [Saitozyma sp. JCM 24511]|nr:hypothetical protein JCM24511_01518 [Saitozyma sp. JCM 24511]